MRVGFKSRQTYANNSSLVRSLLTGYARSGDPCVKSLEPCSRSPILGRSVLGEGNPSAGYAMSLGRLRLRQRSHCQCSIARCLHPLRLPEIAIENCGTHGLASFQDIPSSSSTSLTSMSSTSLSPRFSCPIATIAPFNRDTKPLLTSEREGHRLGANRSSRL